MSSQNKYFDCILFEDRLFNTNNNDKMMKLKIGCLNKIQNISFKGFYYILFHVIF